jgi:hypothetical protein
MLTARCNPARLALAARPWKLAAASILGAALACATGPSPPPSWNHPETALLWPQGTERARIEYLGVLRTPADLGRKLGLFARLKTIVFGEQSVALVKPISVAKNEAGMRAGRSLVRSQAQKAPTAGW